MRTPRFHIDATLAVGERVSLPDELAHHAARVLRLRAGDRFVLFDGRGGEFGAVFEPDRHAAQARIVDFDDVERESPLQLTLLQALVTADKLDWIVEKTVELGVARIMVVPMQRSVAQLDAARSRRRLVHWRQIARSACSQCGRNRVPEVDYADSLGAALAVLPADETRLLLSPVAAATVPCALPGQRVTLLVGPEGGTIDAEVHQAEAAGFLAARLGPRILRTETAGVAAIAALQATCGDLAACRPSGRSSHGDQHA
jgi:16S rRNA (uracil1498-N3)-methyltransferase